VVVVVASYPGASPAEMERLIIKPIEDQVDGIEHLDTLNATAQEGSAVVVVQFQLGTDLDFAAIGRAAPCRHGARLHADRPRSAAGDQERR